MKPEISLQLYSVREQAAADYEGVIRAVADMGYGSVEPAGFPGTTVAAAAKLYRDLGLNAPSCHCALPVGENRNQVIDDALTLGVKYLVTGCPPKFKESMDSVDAIKKTAALYCEAAEFTAAHGLQVGYHNHDWDLAEVDGRPAYRYFLENTPETVLWEADLFWVARAGYDVVEFVKEIGPRGTLLHFKDGIVDADAEFAEAETEDGKIMVSSAKPFLPAGTGQVDLLAASEVAQYVKFAIVELDSYEGDMLKAVKESYDYLTRTGIAQGRK